MTDMKSQLELKLIAAQLSDWCKHKEGIIFHSSLCTQERVLRFQTPLLLDLFPNSEKNSGVWKSGRFIMYEIYNGSAQFKITCSFGLKGLTRSQHKDGIKLIEKCGAAGQAEQDLYFLQEWQYPSAAGKLDKIMEAIQDFSEFEMSYFETELSKWLKDHEYVIKSFPDISQTVIEKDELPDELLVEGGMKDILTNKYERNMTARKKCIAYYGTSCQICGFDFGEKFSPEFSGKIHVHHKIPLYTIKSDYVVDPIKDLIPVCPNCHMVLHSKPDGFYTVEEVRDMLKH